MHLPLRNSITLTAAAIALGLVANAATSHGLDPDAPCRLQRLWQGHGEEVAMPSAPSPVVQSDLPATRL